MDQLTPIDVDSDDDEEVIQYKEDMAQKQHYCFAPETLIWTPAGLTPLHALTAGDRVYSLDPNTGDLTTNTVQAVLQRRVHSHLELTINGHTLATTEDHPFYLHSGELCSAQNLQVDATLCSAFDPAPCVDAVDYIDAPLDVINLTLDAPHTFFICPDPNADSYEDANALILVHNCSPIESIVDTALLVVPPVIKGVGPVARVLGRISSKAKQSYQQACIERLTKAAKPGQKTSGSSTQFERTGGFSQAKRDFEALRPSHVKDVHKNHPTKTTLVGKLEDGRHVIVRNHSKSYRPTLEIQNGINDYTKFRYIE